MIKIICNLCGKEIKESQVFNRESKGDYIDVVLDSWDTERCDGEFHICKSCVKKIGQKGFVKIGDKYCFMEEDEDFTESIWKKKKNEMLKELRKLVE